MPSLLGSVLINRKLPGRQKIVETVSNVAKNIVKNPIKTVKDGIARDRAAVGLMKAGTGMNRLQAVKQIAPALSEGVYKAGGKDLLVNTGGFAGSVVGSPLGAVGALAGDWLGARGTRRILNNREIATNANKIRTNLNFQRLSNQQQKEILRKRRLGFGKKYAGEQLLEDTVGWGIGNGAATGLTAAGVGVPLKGAAVAIPTTADVVKGVRTGNRFARRTGNKMRGVAASGVSSVRNLRRRYSIRRGLNREQQAYDTINNTLQRRLPQLPEGLDFSAPTFFLADFCQSTC